jgi:FMN phosphatase YigB (HAD superfamily)
VVYRGGLENRCRATDRGFESYLFRKLANRMRYKNIIFDVGGVLLEWNPEELLKKFNFPFCFMEVFDSLLWTAYDGGLLSQKELLNKLPQKYDKKLFASCITQTTLYIQPITAMLDIFFKVQKIGYKVYILSNMAQDAHKKIIASCDFLNSSEGQVYSYLVKAVKPQPQIYETLLIQYQLNAQESIFIDDKEENIIAAKKLGIDGITYKNPIQVQQELIKRKIPLTPL